MSSSLFEFLNSAESSAENVDDVVLSDAAEARIREFGVSRRKFLTAIAGMASLMALPQSVIPKLAEAATSPKKPSMVFMSFQECTGCLESLVNSFAFRGGASIENLILNLVSLDYQETLMAAAGEQAEEQLLTSTATPNGYILIVDGSIPANANSGYFISGGRSGVARFRDAAKNAKAIVAVGTCAAFGGLPMANPNPTGAVPISTLMKTLGISKPLINVSGCPPIPEVITGTILYYLAYGVPSLDNLRRPSRYYGEDVHDDCYRKERDDSTERVLVFDDARARKGGCLINMGCKGPRTHNACTTIKWNQGISFPMMSGHGCLGCSEPGFWDWGGFYVANGGSGD